jgi:hypothetical protein
MGTKLQAVVLTLIVGLMVWGIVAACMWFAEWLGDLLNLVTALVERKRL